MVLSVFSYSQKGANYQLTDFHLSKEETLENDENRRSVFLDSCEEAGGKRRVERRLKRVGLGF